VTFFSAFFLTTVNIFVPNVVRILSPEFSSLYNIDHAVENWRNLAEKELKGVSDSSVGPMLHYNCFDRSRWRADQTRALCHDFSPLYLL